ncbi:MAG: hypothetical protein K0U52_00275, partial [Gammaproteobacteria bacterium]|nr:hypothetical protein [Gammaproteobacteria bacterium]
MPFWIHPAWKDIFLRVREEMGDEVIYCYFNYNSKPRWKLPPFVYSIKYYSAIEIQDYVLGGNYANLKTPLEIDREGLERYLYNIDWSENDRSSDYSIPLKEIYLYDGFFLRAFNSMLYDGMDYFKFDDEGIKKVSELKIKINNICVQVWEEKYGRKWDGITPHVNVNMQDTLFLGYLGYPIPFDDYEEWSWVNLQFVRYKTWVEEIYRNYIMKTAGIVSLSKKTPSNL